MVFQGRGSFRNVHCAICNGAALDKVICLSLALWGRGRNNWQQNFNTFSFAVLFDINGGSEVGVGKRARQPKCLEVQKYEVAQNALNFSDFILFSSHTSSCVSQLFELLQALFLNKHHLVQSWFQHINVANLVFLHIFHKFFHPGGALRSLLQEVPQCRLSGRRGSLYRWPLCRYIGFNIAFHYLDHYHVVNNNNNNHHYIYHNISTTSFIDNHCRGYTG